MLLEVLIALLIFALGVLGLVGLQANAVRQSSDTQHRAEAALLANELIGQMWVGNRTFAGLSAAFASNPAGPQYTAWLARVEQALPGASAFPPTVTLVQVPPLASIVNGAPVGPAPADLTPSTLVTVTLQWKAPGDPATDPPRNLVMNTEIK